MADLPYWFTSEDRTNPVFCRACKQHIPRAAYMAGQGLCQSCLKRQASQPASAAMPTTAAIPSPSGARAPGLRSVTSPSPVPSDSAPAEKMPTTRPQTATVVAIGLLLAGAAIAIVRLMLHI